MWRLEDGKSRQSKEAKAGPSEEKFVEDTDTLSKRNLTHESKFIVRSLAFCFAFPLLEPFLLLCLCFSCLFCRLFFDHCHHHHHQNRHRVWPRERTVSRVDVCRASAERPGSSHIANVHHQVPRTSTECNM